MTQADALQQATKRLDRALGQLEGFLAIRGLRHGVSPSSCVIVFRSVGRDARGRHRQVGVTGIPRCRPQ